MQAWDPGMESGEGSKEDTEMEVKNRPQKQNKCHSKKGITHVPYFPSMADTPDPHVMIPDWATLNARKILRDIMMDGDLEGWNILMEIYNECKRRRVTLDHRVIVINEAPEDKIRWQHNNQEMTPGVMEAPVQQMGSGWMDGSRAVTRAALIEI